ncbi:cupredoxin domain-containing protein [Microtetraspora malaysiensis]|uniref:Uncharacterized protein n=1 Tax=Microtetraspora malaysiensis TaxID=161358 RepID=A0ABW6SV78_9ACTN
MVNKEGVPTLRQGDPRGAQALDLAPAQNGSVELPLLRPAITPIADHDMRQVKAVPHGVLRVSAL